MKWLKYPTILFFALMPLCAQIPIVEIQLQHSGKIIGIDFSPDGKWIVTGSQDNQATLWNIQSQKTLHLPSHRGPVNAVDFSPDGKYIASGSHDGMIQLWDMVRGLPSSSLSDSFPIEALRFKSNSKQIITCGMEGIRVWDLAQKKTVWSWPALQPKENPSQDGMEPTLHFDDFAISPDGNRVAAAGGTYWTGWVKEAGYSYKRPKNYKTGYLRLIDTDTGEEWNSLRIPSGIMWKAVTLGQTRLAISGNFSATDSPDHRVLIFNLETGNLYRQLNMGSSDVNTLRFNPDESSLFVVLSSDDPKFSGRVERWDIATSTLIDSSKMATSVVAFSDDGSRIAGGWQNSLLIAPTDRFRNGFYFIGPEHAISIFDFDLDEEQGRLVCANLDKTILWDLKSGSIERAWSTVGEYQTIRKTRFNGRSIVTAGYKGLITHWDSSGQNVISSMQHPLLNLFNLNPIKENAFATSGFSIPSSGEDTLRFWNVKDGTLSQIKTAHYGKILCMRKSPDGKFWITGGGESKLSGGGGSLRMWEDGSWATLKDIRLSDSSLEVNDVIIYPDNRTAVAVTDQAFRLVIDLSSGQVMQRIDDSLNYGVVAELSPDAKFYACGNGNSWLSISRDHDIRLYDATTHKLIRKLTGHRLPITRIKFTRNGEFLVSSSLDGTIRFWNLRNSEVTTLIGASDDTYAIATENGNYMTSKAGRELVAFRNTMRLMTFEQFDLAFNRPDIILGRLGFISPDRLSVYQKAGQKRIAHHASATKNSWSRQDGPELKVLTETPPETSDRIANLKITIRDASSNLSQLFIRVNDVPMYGRNGLSLKDRKSRAAEINVPIVLSPGKNRIQISSTNQLGAESLPEIFETTFTGVPDPSDVIVIAVGVAKYKDADYNLTYSGKDAVELSSVFRSLGKHSAGKYDNILLIDSSATRENIKSVRNRLLATKPNDRVILFFAGHGLLDEKQDWYFATYDIDFNNPSGRGLSYSEIENLLDGIPARRRLVLMDACHSGEVDRESPGMASGGESDRAAGTSSRGVQFKKIGSGELATQTISSRGFKPTKIGTAGLQNSFELMKEIFADLQNDMGATVISSASGTEVALEGGEWKNGVFTYAVLQGLAYRKADLNSDHRIRCSELQSYVMKSVRSLTAGKQTPTARKEKLIDDFELGELREDLDPKDWRPQ